MKLLTQLSAQTPLKYPENNLSKKVGGWAWRRELNILIEDLSFVPSTHKVAITPILGDLTSSSGHHEHLLFYVSMQHLLEHS